MYMKITGVKDRVLRFTHNQFSQIIITDICQIFENL